MTKIKPERTLVVQGTTVALKGRGDDEYISLTDMLRAKEGDFFIGDWLRNRNTVEFLGVWERVHNPAFNPVEFATIRSQAGLNSYRISVKDWVEKTGAIGVRATAGRYGGTYAHPDIAFEFAMWISPEFKVYLVQEFRRLKQAEVGESREWNFQRTLAKVNYRIHTDAIQANLVPPTLTKAQVQLVYASEADLLNMALFGKTAAEWRKGSPKLSGNMRDHATIEQLVVLSNLESLNSVLIHQGVPSAERLRQLNEIAIVQVRSLLASPTVKQLTAGKMR
jgi:KilA-N domain